MKPGFHRVPARWKPGFMSFTDLRVAGKPQTPLWPLVPPSYLS